MSIAPLGERQLQGDAKFPIPISGSCYSMQEDLRRWFGLNSRPASVEFVLLPSASLRACVGDYIV